VAAVITAEKRCWFPKTANVLAALPESAHPGAKKALAKITDDLGQVLAFCDFPAGHWAHLQTTSPIQSTFATVRHRTKVTKGPGSRAAGLAMAFKLIERPGEDNEPAAPAAA
jgi:hypothetical protein